MLSPVLWRLNNPDRFDMYSLGIIFLQMMFAPLRSDNALIAFNKCCSAALSSLLGNAIRWQSTVCHEEQIWATCCIHPAMLPCI